MDDVFKLASRLVAKLSEKFARKAIIGSQEPIINSHLFYTHEWQKGLFPYPAWTD